MSRKVVARNRRARFDYEILDTFEAGMVLLGSEVKSLRAGQASISEAYVAMRSNEAWLESMTIPPYVYSHLGGHDPTRTRKLLLQRREIDRIAARMREQGLTLIPTQVTAHRCDRRASRLNLLLSCPPVRPVPQHGERRPPLSANGRCCPCIQIER